MTGQLKPRQSLLIISHNRETIADALELANAIRKERDCTLSPEQAKWDAIPGRIRAGLTPVFVRDIGNLSAWEDSLC